MKIEHCELYLRAGLLLISGLAGMSAAAAVYDVKSYGAVGDGVSLATAAIQHAVDACAADGGGKVVVPAGRYLTGPVFLRSRVQVELESGAVLLGSTNFNDYPAISGRWEGIERKVYASLFTGYNLEQVAITGQGIIDGQGAAWWEANRKTGELRQQLGLKEREPDNPPGAPLRWPRPRLINLYSCTNVLIRDLTLRDSPSWNIHPVYCQRVTLDNLTIIAPATSPNTDAVDPDSCRDVRISNCYFDVGDDCVVIKSGYNEDGRRVGIPCENILVSTCIFRHGRGGVVIGSEMSGSVRNVVVDNCVFDGTQRGLRVKTAPGRGGVVEDFRASNLVMRNITDAAFSITAAYADSQSGPKRGETAPGTVPVMRRIHWSNVSVSNTKKVADLAGLTESPLEDFSLCEVQATGAQAGIRCQNARKVRLEGLELQVAAGPAIEAQKVSDLEVFRCAAPGPNSNAPVVLFKAVAGASLRACKVAAGSGVFLQAAGPDNQDISCADNRLAAGIKERNP